MYSWDDLSLPQLLFRNLGPEADQNRPYVIWYWEIVDAALDAAMNECAYGKGTPATLLKAAWPNCKVSNYNDISADGKRDGFGWYFGRPFDHAPPPASPPALTAVRDCIRGQTAAFGTGAQYRWNDFVHDPNGPNERRSLWDTRPSVASGDFSAPELYPTDAPHITADRKKVYEPDWPPVDQESIMLDRARRTVESIINSPGGTPSKVTPWIAGWGTTIPYSGYPTLPIIDSDLRRLLARLRALRVPEILIWWNHVTVPDPAWDITVATMDRVYIPQLDSAWVVFAEADIPIDPDILRYTVRTPHVSAEVIELRAGILGQDRQVIIQVHYDNLTGWNTLDTFELNFEGLVKPVAGTAGDVRGRISVWNGSAWDDQVYINDFPGGGPEWGFGFFAPVNPASAGANAGWYETRRTWPINPSAPTFEEGTLDIQILLRRPGIGSGQGFDVRFDLAQLIGVPGGDCSGCDTVALGADIDRSGSVNPTDLAEFTAAFIAGKRIADANNDGQINALDLSVFGAAYNGPP